MYGADWNDKQERDRARHIIAKAERNGLNPVDELTMHFIPRSLILELTGELPNLKPKVKRDPDAEFYAWAAENAGKVLSSNELADLLEVSYQVAMSKVRKYPDCFSKVKRGTYKVLDALAERAAAKQLTT